MTTFTVNRLGNIVAAVPSQEPGHPKDFYLPGTKFRVVFNGEDTTLTVVRFIPHFAPGELLYQTLECTLDNVSFPLLALVYDPLYISWTPTQEER
jgi:hypothetical protein